MTLSTCALYGGSNYTNNWIGINMLIILLSLALVAVVYTVSRLLPSRTRALITSATRFEITQALLSSIIIAVLIGSAQVVCDTTVSFGGSILRSANVPPQYVSLSPFQYADYYIGTLAQSQGLTLLTSIYSTSVTYGIESHVLGDVGGLISNVLPLVSPLVKSVLSGIGSSGGLFEFKLNNGLSLSSVFNELSWIYLLIFAPLTVMIVGVLFLQYILLPFLQFTAFIVILPAAIAMRSFSFAGQGLRTVSNALLALAIAGYLIYPLMVLFDSYIMYYLGVFPLTGASVCNPSLPTPNQCTILNPNWVSLNAAFYPPQLSPNQFLNQPIITPQGGTQDIAKYVNSALSNGGLFSNILANPFGVVQQSQTIINAMALLAFQGIFLFAINLAVTVGFALGLAKALNAGIEGAGNFWGNL